MTAFGFLPAELAAQVLAHLDGPSVRNAAVVNRLWFEKVTDVLWGKLDGDAVKNLKIVKRARRLVYARKLRVLDFHKDSDSTTHTLFQGLVFARLEKLRLVEVGGWPSWHNDMNNFLASYLRPTLKHLTIWDWNHIFTPQFLVQVARSCPELEEVRFVYVGDNISSGDLFLFFQNVVNLKTIELCTERDLITNAIIHQLFRKGELQRVDLLCPLTPEALAHSSSPRKLEHAALHIPSHVVPHAANTFQKLATLDITIQYQEAGLPDIFQPLTVMSELRDLTIRLPPYSIPTSRLLALRSFSQLQSLTIMSDRGPEPLLLSDMNDAGWEILLSSLPKLRFLDWRIYCQFTIDALNSCSGLEKLTLVGRFDLELLAMTAGPLFPNLKRLVLENAFEVYDVTQLMTDDQVARLVDTHAPKLGHLEFLNERENSIQKAWSSL